ncbi:MAG TPA: hypothetical protein PKI94_04640 [Candidatus Gastranaerophilaceae bacterium]|nr:hypothetical protein [Candidatus Gastranaerophilaceae bacterium]
MKKLLVIILYFALCGGVFAQGQFCAIISKMETSLFGIQYESQTDEVRLSRIEENVYGKSSSQPLNKRIERLKKDLSADLIGQEIKPKRDTFAEDEDGRKVEEIPKADPNVNYPIVNNLEKEVFKTEYKTLDINKRLSNLEQKAFNKSFSDESLNSRVDRLKAKILPETKLAEKSNESDYFYNPEDLDNLPMQGTMSGAAAPDNFSQKDFGDNFDDYESNADIRAPLTSLEKSLFKKAFPDDTVENRLTRLEAKIFSTSFVQDDPQTRMARIASAQQAKKSAKKYDGNKFAQHMSTAMQIGAIVLMILACVL